MDEAIGEQSESIQTNISLSSPFPPSLLEHLLEQVKKLSLKGHAPLQPGKSVPKELLVVEGSVKETAEKAVHVSKTIPVETVMTVPNNRSVIL